MDIQIGDRVTCRDITKDKIYIVIINDTRDLTSKKWIEKQIADGYIEILKIERPKYEVVEEKKELLTEEEREFLRLYIKVHNYYIRKISKSINTILFYGKGINYDKTEIEYDAVGTIEVNDEYFNKLEDNKIYTLKELGLE